MTQEEQNNWYNSNNCSGPITVSGDSIISCECTNGTNCTEIIGGTRMGCPCPVESRELSGDKRSIEDNFTDITWAFLSIATTCGLIAFVVLLTGFRKKLKWLPAISGKPIKEKLTWISICLGLGIIFQLSDSTILNFEDEMNGWNLLGYSIVSGVAILFYAISLGFAVFLLLDLNVPTGIESAIGKQYDHASSTLSLIVIAIIFQISSCVTYYIKSETN